VTIPKNVQRGVALLDERLPGWRRNVSRDVNLASDCDCVLGELFGSYSKGLDVLNLSGAEAERYGFFRQSWQTWDKLTNAWRKVIA
jgi:hypothetical protein